MADSTLASGGGDRGSKQDMPPMHQPADDVEMENLTLPLSDPSAAGAQSQESRNGGDRDQEPASDKDPPNPDASAEVASAPENEELTIDPVEPKANNAMPFLSIMLQLTNGARHPFRIDEKYLVKRNVTITGTTGDGKPDPASITVYTLKELILRDWRKEWEEPPREPSSIRLIHFGKLLEDRNQLSHYNFGTTSKNWVHMTVKPQDLLDEEEAAKKVKDSSSHSGRGGCCVIL
ncbi:ubiquitin-related domain-containing protein [Poronia punctata]|nr:ubiquitin-related domain-containing protein [Poronia punctata]